VLKELGSGSAKYNIRLSLEKEGETNPLLVLNKSFEYSDSSFDFQDKIFLEFAELTNHLEI
ncbi:MAG: hypothetical protein ACRCX2_15035, partial [Paraclostridium sp.]